MELDRRKKFLSANTIIQGFMEKVVFESGLDIFYMWQKWRRNQRELGKWRKRVRKLRCSKNFCLQCRNYYNREKLEAGREVIFYRKQQFLLCGF